MIYTPPGFPNQTLLILYHQFNESVQSFSKDYLKSIYHKNPLTSKVLLQSCHCLVEYFCRKRQFLPFLDELLHSVCNYCHHNCSPIFRRIKEFGRSCLKLNPNRCELHMFGEFRRESLRQFTSLRLHTRHL